MKKEEIINCIERLADAALTLGLDRRSAAFSNALDVLDALKGRSAIEKKNGNCVHG